MKTLIIAEAANPEWVSVPLEGWSHWDALSRLTDAHLVTQVRNREAILRTGLTEDRFTAIDTEAVASKVWKLGQWFGGRGGKGWTITMAFSVLSYYYFERQVWKIFGPAIQRGDYDIVHRITPLSPTTPSPIAKKCHKAGVPFVLGPLNGGVPWPRAFDKARRQEREWLSYVRDAYKLLPGFHGTRKYASAIIAGSLDTLNQVPTKYREKCVYIPENAVDPSRFTLRRARIAGRPLKLIFVGRLVPYKGADMLIEACCEAIRKGDVQLQIIGDGPQMESLKQTVVDEKIEHGVKFEGWVAHGDLQQHLIEADLFAFPSIREFGGAVALEAMSVGLVPMVVRYGGLGELVTNETGYLIEMSDRRGIVEGFRRTLESVLAQPEQISTKAIAALRRVEEFFTWDKKASQVLEVYRWVLGKVQEKPDWGILPSEVSSLAKSR